MTLFIVDASVAVKWLLPEPLAAEAMRLQSANYQLHAPSFMDVEVANVLWKKVRQGLISRDEADVILSHVPGLPLTRHADASVLVAAFDLAGRLDRFCIRLHVSRLGSSLGRSNGNGG